VQAPPHAGEERLPQKAAPPRLSVFGGRALASPERVNLQAEVASRPCFDEKALGCRVFGPGGELNAGARCQVSLDESALKAALGVNDGPWCGQGPCALPTRLQSVEADVHGSSRGALLPCRPLAGAFCAVAVLASPRLRQEPRARWS
jgi:hypothetical protein